MQIKLDKIFEFVVAVLLRQNGYRVPVPGRYLEGRGGIHQIDCIGLYPYPAPFIFPIRIVAEAKCYGRGKIGINFVRNLHSEISDLEQTLPRIRTLHVQSGWEPNQSCSYHGAMFSTVPFTKASVDYANAYCIDLIHFKNKIGDRNLIDYIKDLKLILQECIKVGSPYFCEEKGVNRQIIEKLRQKKSYNDLDWKEKSLFLDIIEWILTRCVKVPNCMPYIARIKPLSEELFKKKLGSIEGHAVMFDFTDEEFQKLRSATIKRFSRRSEEGGNPFYPPPDDEYGPNKKPPEGGPLSHIKSEIKYTEAEKYVDVSFFFDLEGTTILTNARIGRFVYENFMGIKFPKKVVLPVDVGCFYYGLWQ